MAKPTPMRQFYATPDRKDAPENQRVLQAVFAELETYLVEGQYGTISLTVKVVDGILQPNGCEVLHRRALRL